VFRFASALRATFPSTPFGGFVASLLEGIGGKAFNRKKFLFFVNETIVKNKKIPEEFLLPGFMFVDQM
jgi:hypothetical protein